MCTLREHYSACALRGSFVLTGGNLAQLLGDMKSVVHLKQYTVTRGHSSHKHSCRHNGMMLEHIGETVPSFLLPCYEATKGVVWFKGRNMKSRSGI